MAEDLVDRQEEAAGPVAEGMKGGEEGDRSLERINTDLISWSERKVPVDKSL